MSTEHERLKQILAEASGKKTPEARAAYLDAACQGDAGLRAEVERLLKAHESAGDFLEQSAVPLETDFRILTTGNYVGRYKLLQEIGEGGFGRVFMAEQTEPVHRRVALKIVKAGMDTREVIARFEAERQALALMDHPNIARVLDAGATETGRPYFVMELVKGIPITDYCDREHLSTSERLGLFMQVCHAVQHAHQKAIIHRDLKPTNILVTLIDGKPVPKIIDFGVAKALGQRLTEKTLFTRFEEFLGTPAYMSPEQAELSGVDVDTRSDIYSLGVLLYELLTGVTPFDTETFRKAALDEVRRIIREVEPPKPSTRLQALVSANVRRLKRTSDWQLTEEEIRASSRRLLQIKETIRLMHGDLDWIVMKCLEKERGRRYETAGSLAEDVQRHLGHEPVLASPPGTLYRANKFVRRHRVGVTMTTALVLLSITGTFVSTWQAVRAKRAEKAARTEAAKATAASEFMLDLIRSATPGTLKGKDYTVRQMLDDYSGNVSERLKGQPEVEATVRLTIGRAYSQLGLFDKAVPQLEQALALFRRVSGTKSQWVVETLTEYAWAMTGYHSQELTPEQRWEKAKPYLHEALEIARRQGDTRRDALIWALHVEEWYMMTLGRDLEVERVVNEALAIAATPPKLESSGLASMMHNLAWVRIRQGRFHEAEVLARQAVGIHRRTSSSNDFNLGWSLSPLGQALLQQGNLSEARTVTEEALKIFSFNYSLEDNSVVSLRDRLVTILESQQDWPALEVLLRQTLAVQRTSLLNSDAADKDEKQKNLTKTVCSLAGALHHLGRDGEALTLFREAADQRYAEAQYQLGRMYADGTGVPKDEKQAIKWLGKAGVQGHLRAIRDLNAMLRPQGRLGEMEAIFRKEVAARKQRLANEHPDVAFSLNLLGDRLRDEGKWDEAEAVVREGLEMRRKLFGNEHPDVAVSLQNLALVFEGQGRLAEAEATTRQALAMRRKLFGDGHWAVNASLTDLARELTAQGKLAEAEGRDGEALTLFREAADQGYAEAQYQLGRMYAGGTGVPKDEKQAIKWLGKAGVQGHLRAIRDLNAMLRPQGRLGEMEAIFRKEVAARKQRLGNEHLDVAKPLGLLADSLIAQGKLTEAEDALREVLALQKKNLGDDHLDVASTYDRLAALARIEGQRDEADRLHHEALAIQKKHWAGQAENGDSKAENRLAWMLATCDDATIRDGPRAIGYAEKAVAATNRKKPEMLNTLAAAYAEAGQFTNAIEVVKEATALVTNSADQSYCDYLLKFFESNTAYRVGNISWLISLGDDLLAKKMLAQAETAFCDAVAEAKARVGREHRSTALSLNRLGLVQEDQNKLAKAEAADREALAIWKRLLPGDLRNIAYLAHNLARVLKRQGKASEAEAIRRDLLEHQDAFTLNNLAWQLATLSDANKRDGPWAVKFAERAVAATSRTNATYLDTLAAAYAEVSDFPKAISVQKECLSLPDPEHYKKGYESRLRLFESNSPYRQP